MEALLDNLEKKLKTFVDQYHGLTRLNQVISHERAQMLDDKQALLERQQKAIMRIKTLITRLKAIEGEKNDRK